MRDQWIPRVLARAQHGAISRAQAHAAGMSNRALSGAVERGTLVHRHRDVFLLPGSRSLKSEDWAATLAAGDGAVMSGWSAARRLGLDWPRISHGEPCVSVPPNRHVRLVGVRVLRWALPDVDVVRHGAVLVTTPDRTVVDCLRLAPATLQESMLDTALLREWITLDAFGDQVRNLFGQRGVGALRVLLAGVGAGARSRAERLAQEVLGRTGIAGWQWNHPVPLPDGSLAVVDAALPDLRIAVEIDGRAYHVDVEAFQRDRTRQNGLVAMGWTVLRFTWWDLTNRPDYVVDVVRRAVARAS